MSKDHNINEVEMLISQHLDQCTKYPNVCKLIETATGRNRVKDRIKEILLNDGIPSIESAIATVETELIFS